MPLLNSLFNRFILSYNKRGLENILILFSLFTTFSAVLAFSIYRLISNEIVIAAVDFMISLMLLGVLIKAYQKKLDHVIKVVLVIGYSLGACAVILLKGNALVYWAYPPIISTFFLLEIKSALKINFVYIPIVLVIVLPQVEHLEFFSILTTFIILFIFGYILTARSAFQHKKLTQLASIDPLTRTLNKRSLEETIVNKIDTYKEHPEKSVLMMLDLDNFKRINDTYGHSVGDNVLIEFTKLLEDITREEDTLYRFGGEEFVIISDKTTLEMTQNIAERIRKTIEESLAKEYDHMTVSIGLTEISKIDDKDSWLDRADQALYKAKENGRNKIYVAPKNNKDSYCFTPPLS